MDGLIARVPYVILLILSLTVHEFAHAWSAWRLGDDTAEREGRMTLNPLVHIDLFGTILLPLFNVPFGWAKPVPVNPTRFDRRLSMGAGMAITAGAGPAANIVLAALSALGLGLLQRFAPDTESFVPAMLWNLLGMNVALAVFNLIPLPPLDGSRIVAWLMPYRLRDQWHALERFSPILLLGVFFLAGRLISAPINYVATLLLGLARLVA